MQKSREYQVLLYAFTQVGCPLCRLVQESIQKFLEAWKYELFTDRGIRGELRQTQGFCHDHTWQLVRLGASLPLAQAYRDIVTDAIEQLQSGGALEAPQAGRGFFRLFAESKSDERLCPACKRETSVEEGHIQTLRQAIQEEEFRQQFVTSQGLCLGHFRQACELKLSGSSGDWLTPLREAELACLRRLDEQLGELIRKHDYRFKDEQLGAEMLSWKWAAGLVAGDEPQ